jgi:hypothetical protein
MAGASSLDARFWGGAGLGTCTAPLSYGRLPDGNGARALALGAWGGGRASLPRLVGRECALGETGLPVKVAPGASPQTAGNDS